MGVLYIKGPEGLDEMGLEPGKEILVEFYLGSQGKNELNKVAVEAGQTIRAEVSGKMEEATGQWTYRVFRYRVKPATTIQRCAPMPI